MIVKHKEYDIGNNKRIVAYYSENENTEISKEVFEDVVIPALQIADRLEQADEKKMARRMICDTCSEAETCGQGELGDWCGEYGVLLKTVRMALADIRGDDNG